MENYNKETVENNNVEETGNSGTQATQNKDEETKSFSQDEVNTLLKKEKEKYSKKMPDEKTYKAFKKWQEDQKTDAQKNAEKETEYENTKKQLSETQKELAVYKAGVNNSDDVEFVTFKVSKIEGDFQENLNKFLKENPKYLGETKIVKKVGSSLNLSGKTTKTGSETNQTMNDLIRSVKD